MELTDRILAEMAGWKSREMTEAEKDLLVSRKYQHLPYFILEDGDGVTWLNTVSRVPEYSWHDVPNYLGSVDAALTLLNTSGRELQWRLYTTIDADGSEVYKCIVRRLEGEWYHRTADAPAQAISKAWVAWKEAQDE